jgi:hypothetical protein
VTDTNYDDLELRQENAALLTQLSAASASKDAAYAERNRLVHALCSVAQLVGWPCGKRLHEGAEWDPAWRTVIMIDLPTGQVSWHIHDSEFALFAHLPAYPGSWDGHGTSEKYDRLLALEHETMVVRSALLSLRSAAHTEPP